MDDTQQVLRISLLNCDRIVCATGIGGGSGWRARGGRGGAGLRCVRSACNRCEHTNETPCVWKFSYSRGEIELACSGSSADHDSLIVKPNMFRNRTVYPLNQ